METGLKEAIAAYERGDQGPFLVAKQVPWVVYDAWMCELECCWRLQYRSGDVWMHGDPSIVHETVSSWFNFCIITQIATIPGVESALDVITPARASRLKTITGDKEPDQCYFPGSSLSKVRAVIEIAYKNETLQVLRDVVDMWEKSGCSLAIGAKITSDMNLTFLAKQHGGELKEIEFAPHVCNQSNRDQFVVKFPVSCFTGDLKGQHYIQIDLFELQEYIIRMMEQERAALEDADENPNTDQLFRSIKQIDRLIPGRNSE